MFIPWLLSSQWPCLLRQLDPNPPAQGDFYLYHQGDPGLPGKAGERGLRVSVDREMRGRATGRKECRHEGGRRLLEG